MDLFPNIGNLFRGFYIVFGIMTILSIGIFIFVFFTIFSPKMRAKLVSQNIKAQKQILDDNKEILKDISEKNADLENISFQKKVKTIQEAFKEEKSQKYIYCQNCGQKNDENAIYCQKCGKKI